MTTVPDIFRKEKQSEFKCFSSVLQAMALKSMLVWVHKDSSKPRPSTSLIYLMLKGIEFPKVLSLD